MISDQFNVPSENRENLGESTLSRESATSELRNLIIQIRTNTGFEDFQGLLTKNKLLETLPNQGIVLSNTIPFRTDAILINGNKTVQVLPLERSIFQISKEY